MKRTVSLIVFAALLSVNCAQTPTTPTTPAPNPPADSRISLAMGYSTFRVGIAGHLRLEIYGGAPSAVTLDFGDGTEVDLGTTTSADVAHVYTNTGSFTVTATVTAPSGVTSARLNLTVAY